MNDGTGSSSSNSSDGQRQSVSQQQFGSQDGRAQTAEPATNAKMMGREGTSMAALQSSQSVSAAVRRCWLMMILVSLLCCASKGRADADGPGPGFLGGHS